MSKEIDEQMMGQIAGLTGEPEHRLVENQSTDMLISGSVLIRRSQEDLSKAEALRDMAERAVAAIKAGAAIMLLACVTVSLLGSLAVAQTTRPTWTPRTEAERSWGAMSKDELKALNRAARAIKSQRIDIVCGGNFCRSLSEDLDEALESAGHDVYLEQPLFDLGKGAAISPDSETSRDLARMIEAATSGRVKLKVMDAKGPDGKTTPLDKIIIGIGRKPHG